MRKRTQLCLVTVAVLFVLGFATVLLRAQHPRPGITRENFDRIQKGMTRAEVEEILGGPPGTYTDRYKIIVLDIDDTSLGRCWWVGDEGFLSIWLTDDKPCRVFRKEFDPHQAESLAEKCRRICPWLPSW
jgi:hypothetical protein